jgi:hypothetical protein
MNYLTDLLAQQAFHQLVAPVSAITRMRRLLLILVFILTGCNVSRSGRVEELTGDQVVIQALLQLQDMPFDWHIIENSQSRNVFKCDGESYTRAFAPIFKPNRDAPVQVYVSHTLFDCKNTTTAEARFYESSYPNPNLVDPITRFAAGHMPSSADTFRAYCGTLSDESTVCMTIARYGRLVSVIEVYKRMNGAAFPTENDILRWTVDRNDRMLSRFSK